MNRRTTIAPLLIAAFAAVLVAPSASSAAGTACVPGKTTVGGKAATRFCGPAKAVANVGAKKFVFSGGVCEKSAAYFTVNIGTIMNSKVANAKPGPLPYFGIALTPVGTGVHLRQALTWIAGGKRYSVLGNQITLKKDLMSGTFKGRALGGQKVTGTFTC
jgi:hypothetical protein